MIEKTSHHGVAGSRKFIPQMKALESRLLLSQSLRVGFPDGTSFIVPAFVNLPRTGGEFAQTGSLLRIGAGQPTTNTVHVVDNGSGGVTAEWNGLPNHVLTGVDTTVIQLRRAGHDQVTIQNGGDMSTGVTATGNRVAAMASVRRTSGAAVQSGSVLTVTVTSHATNTVAISNEGAGGVLVEWNGGAVHSFKGVETIVVDTKNAKNDLVALHDVTG